MNYIACTGGGTGGHIYPGLAVCDEIRSILQTQKDSYKFLWIGNSSGMDKTIVEKSMSIDVFKGIPCGKLRRYFSLQNILDIMKIAAGFFASLSILLTYKPVFLFSKGGFVSVAPCYAAKILGIPVFTHECDFSPGLATRLTSGCARKIFISYEQTKSCFTDKIKTKLIVTGNPVRKIFYESDPSRGLQFLFGSTSKPDLPVLFVLGGSSGALQINDLVEECFQWLVSNFIVVHQTGKNIRSEKKQVHENYHAFEFIFEQMSHVLAASDIILARSGANTLWEAAVQGKPMVLIPLSGSGTRGDQVENAELFRKNGAAEVLLGTDVSRNGLIKALTVMSDVTTRNAYALNSKKMAAGNRPAESIAQIIYKELEEALCL